MYYAIIGDIKNSKEIDNRYEVQNKLKKILDDINLKYKSDIKHRCTRGTNKIK